MAGKEVAELVTWESRDAELVMGRGIAELLTGERGSRVSDVGKGAAELVVRTGVAQIVTRARSLQN